MSAFEFDVEFRGPFLVASGYAELGIDDAVDPHDPLPLTAWKGVLRAEADHRLGFSLDLVHGTFGCPAHPAAWAWSRPNNYEVTRQAANRLQLTPEGLAKKGMLASQQVAWGAPVRLRADFRSEADIDRDDASLVLRAAAHSLSGLGSGRRRGRGWVRVQVRDAHREVMPWTTQDTDRLVALLKPGQP